MKAWHWAVLLFAALVLQSTVLTRLRLLGAQPDLILLFAVSWSLLRGWRGAALGLAGGLLLDMARGEFIGALAFPYFVVGLLVAAAERHLFKENPWLPILGAVAGTFVVQGLFWVLAGSFGYPIPVSAWLAGRLPQDILFNALMAYPVHYGISRLDQRLSRRGWMQPQRTA